MRSRAKFFAVFIFLSLLLSFFVGCGGQEESSESRNGASAWDEWPGETYAADFSDGLPSDWFGKSTDKTTESVGGEGGLILKQEGSVSSKYAVYNVRQDISYGDFRLEMNAKINAYDTEASWFGLMYHVRANGTKTSGYAVAKSIGGSVSHQIFGENKRLQTMKAADAAAEDGALHTIVLESLAGSAALFVDGREISAFDCSMGDGVFGKTYLSGGLAIALNNCELEIFDLRIKGDVVVGEKDAITDSKLSGNGSIVKNVNVAVISELKDSDALGGLSTTDSSAVILTADGNGRAVDERGEPIAALSEVCARLENRAYPVFRVTDRPSANALLVFLRYEYCISDAAVMASSYELLDYVKERNINIRGVLDASGERIESTDGLWRRLSEANDARANTLLLNLQSATKENVDFVQARFKTVWAAVNGDGFDVDKAVAAGVNGIVTDGEAVAFERLQAFSAAGMRLGSAFVAAHRGNGSDTYENSLPAFVGAYEDGATHIELDIQLSKDGKAVVMHDATLDRTTDGSGFVSAMTWEQISRYKIVKNSAGAVCGEGVKIPCLEDVYEVFRDKDCVLVVELKSDDDRLAGEFARITKEYGMEKNVVAISFYNGSLGATNQLAKTAERLPAVSTADLQSPDASDLASTFLLLSRNNSGIDFQSDGNVSEGLRQAFTARGYGLWVWTVDGSTAINRAWSGGAVGVTTNYVRDVAGTKTRLIAEAGELRFGSDGLNEAEDILGLLRFVSLDGKLSSASGARIFSSRENEHSVEIVCCANNGTRQTIYGVFTILK